MTLRGSASAKEVYPEVDEILQEKQSQEDVQQVAPKAVLPFCLGRGGGVFSAKFGGSTWACNLLGLFGLHRSHTEQNCNF